MMDKIHLRIGSYPDNDMIIESEGVDGHHLELFCDSDGNVFITDLNTKNGTFINGEELSGYALLKLGDKVVLGRHYVFRWESFIRKKQINESKHEENAESINLKMNSSTISEHSQKFGNLNVENKELFLIYALILSVILLIIFT